MEVVKSPWEKGVLMICEKCGRRDDGCGEGKDFAEDLKKTFKARFRDDGFGKTVRVVTSSCLSLCPKKEAVAGWASASGGEISLAIFDGKKEIEELYEWAKKKAK